MPNVILRRSHFLTDDEWESVLIQFGLRRETVDSGVFSIEFTAGPIYVELIETTN